MKSFEQRLRICMDKGGLTRADLAFWFGRPFHTVRMWTLGAEPRAVWGADKCLQKLEALINKKTLPMPVYLTQDERRELLKKLVHDRDARLSQTRSAG